MNTRDAITSLIFINDEPKPVDLILVLGCPAIANMDPAISLYGAGLTRQIVITGHGPENSSDPEWLRYKEYALNHGIPESALLIEPNARNTQENFLFSEALLAREVGWDNISSIAIASRPIHARRALMTARNYFPDHIKFTMLSPVEDTSIKAATWWQSKAGSQRVLNEVRKIGEYALLGHLGDY